MGRIKIAEALLTASHGDRKLFENTIAILNLNENDSSLAGDIEKIEKNKSADREWSEWASRYEFNLESADSYDKANARLVVRKLLKKYITESRVKEKFEDEVYEGDIDDNHRPMIPEEELDLSGYGEFDRGDKLTFSNREGRKVIFKHTGRDWRVSGEDSDKTYMGYLGPADLAQYLSRDYGGRWTNISESIRKNEKASLREGRWNHNDACSDGVCSSFTDSGMKVKFFMSRDRWKYDGYTQFGKVYGSVPEAFVDGFDEGNVRIMSKLARKIMAEGDI